MNLKNVSLAISCSLLVACGGGGNSDDEDSGVSPSALTGIFLDSPVSGLRYETATLSGVTNEGGEFYYEAGEQVTFYVGGIQLGVTQGQETVTPFSLYGISPLTTESHITSALSSSQAQSFDAALNVATLLQGLDQDGNPDNGIDLGEADTALTQESLNLFVKSTTFSGSVELARILDKAGASAPPTLHSVATHLYDSLELQIASSDVAVFTATLNNKALESVSYEYDSDGNVVSEAKDTNNDGTPDITKHYAYDDKNRTTQITDSVSGSTETLGYDDNDNVIERVIVNPDSEGRKEVYTYTANQLTSFTRDLGSDGTIDQSTSYRYDINGNVIRHQIDKDGDGVLDVVTQYSHLGSNVSSFQEDKNNDGIADISASYTYDAQGNRIKSLVDRDADGEIDETNSFQYDSLGNVVLFQQDRDGDDIAEYAESYAYDQYNNRTEYKRDNDGDGNWDFVAQYSYDENGNRTRMIEDSDGNGIVDKLWKGQYQAAVFSNSHTWQTILSEL